MRNVSISYSHQIIILNAVSANGVKCLHLHLPVSHQIIIPDAIAANGKMFVSAMSCYYIHDDVLCAHHLNLNGCNVSI